ncbi:3319_t:CDS:2, partial [Acaulospora colombiana]
MALFRGLALVGITIIAVFLFFEIAIANTDINQNQGESVIPLRTHSIYTKIFRTVGSTSVPTQSSTPIGIYDLLRTDNLKQAEFEFKIDGENPNLYGDGMAVWFTTDRAKPGPVFGFIDKFEGLGIFFDTYANSRQPHSFPYVMAMMGDGNTEYDHDNDGKANHLAGCEADIRGRPIATKARITYYKNTYLEVKLQYRAWDQWEPCFTIPNVTLPAVAYLGFSALTGDVS